MPDTDQGTIHTDEDGALSATHPDRDLPVLVAPAIGSEFNTRHFPIFPIACYKMENLHFVFDSSILSPDLPKGIRQLKSLIDLHSQPAADPKSPPLTPPVSIFGHADPVGSDDYNKSLAGRRAASVYGLLTRRTEIWEDLYNDGGQFAINGATGDKWGIRSIQTMLNAFTDPDLQGSTTGLAVDADNGPQTSAAIKRFQTSQGLPADGDPGPATRKALFKAYMDKICLDENGQPFQLDPKKDFLGRGADSAGKGDYQGCSEFNPVLLLSQDEVDYFAQQTDHTGRNIANQPNRRVMVLLYRIGSQVTPSFWPCPSATQGVAGCKKRFWSDGEKRRTNTSDRRKYEDKNDTFACRFYQRQMSGSPCERGKPLPEATCGVDDEVFLGSDEQDD